MMKYIEIGSQDFILYALIFQEYTLQEIQMAGKVITLLKPFLYFLVSVLCFVGFTLLVNSQVLQVDLMFPEQPMVYLVNQNIHTWSDLLAIYLHPQMLDVINVPFFRPSGHFLLYQFLSPWIGWDNTRGLLVVNLIFLALSGMLQVRIYKLLFPGYCVGGYIAFAICLMHPLFLLTRFALMHFEFASIFFMLLSLYCFIVFCQRNVADNTKSTLIALRMRHANWLLGTVATYVIAATFKESTFMLMPVLMVYLGLTLYYLVPTERLFHDVWRNKEIMQTLSLLILIGIGVVTYLSLAMIGVDYPMVRPFQVNHLLEIIFKFMQILFGIPYDDAQTASYGTRHNIFQRSIIPPLDGTVLLGALFLLPLLAYKFIFKSDSLASAAIRRSILFLGIAVIIFLVLPVAWQHAMPWHMAIPMFFLSLLIGFVYESFACQMLPMRVGKLLGFGFAIVIGVSTLLVNQVNYKFLEKYPEMFSYKLSRNAIKHPPLISQPLTSDTLVIVEDSSIPHSEYLLGDSVYPYVYLGALDPHFIVKHPGSYVYPYVYGSTLFRWAYLKPGLKEQIYPFQVGHMDKIVDEEIIYNWLQHYDNIVCLGHDLQGNWHDKTQAFKQNLLIEQSHRHLLVHSYHALPAVALSGKAFFAEKFALPDSMMCKQYCDKNTACAGFTYVNSVANKHIVTACKYFTKVAGNKTFCPQCTGFIKA
jgi:hypothetical protein